VRIVRIRESIPPNQKNETASTKQQAASTKHQAPSHSPNGYAEKQALLQTTVAVLISCLKQTD
jgi:hypothetical protein